MKTHGHEPRGGEIIANLKGQGKEILGGLMLVFIASFLVFQLAAAFNVTGVTLTIVTLAPAILGLGLLLKYLDVF